MPVPPESYPRPANHRSPLADYPAYTAHWDIFVSHQDSYPGFSSTYWGLAQIVTEHDDTADMLDVLGGVYDYVLRDHDRAVPAAQDRPAQTASPAAFAEELRIAAILRQTLTDYMADCSYSLSPEQRLLCLRELQTYEACLREQTPKV